MAGAPWAVAIICPRDRALRDRRTGNLCLGLQEMGWGQLWGDMAGIADDRRLRPRLFQDPHQGRWLRCNTLAKYTVLPPHKGSGWST